VRRCAAPGPPCRARVRPPLGGGLVTRQLGAHRDGLGPRALELSHHELAGMGRGGPVHRAPVVPRQVGAHARRLAGLVADPALAVAHLARLDEGLGIAEAHARAT